MLNFSPDDFLHEARFHQAHVHATRLFSFTVYCALARFVC